MIKSIDPENNQSQIFKTSEKTKKGISTNNGGSSGSFFFYTEDNKYLIKTLPKHELEVFLELLPDIKAYKQKSIMMGQPSLIA